MKPDKILIYVFLLLTISACHQAVPARQFTTEQIHRDLAVLTADSLQGRYAGSEGANMAADYISSRFKEAGLANLPKVKKYQQRFSIDNSKIGAASLEVNGAVLEAGSYWCYPVTEDIRWKDLSQIRQVRIGTEKEMRDSIYQLINSPEPVIVLFDASMQDWIAKLNSYYGTYKRPSWENESKNPPAPVLALVADEIKEGRFEAEVENKSIEMQNVVGLIEGSTHPDEYVVFSAHYDHIGVLPVENGDSIANGADDDASGTTAVMQLAGHFADKQPARSLIFVAFTAEEIGGYGSQYFSRQLNPDQVVAMFNIEMIGKPSKFGPETAFITGFDLTDFGKILQDASKDSRFRFFPDPYPQQDLFYRSDNATLARLGVPAHTISTDQIDSDPYYHTVQDEMSTLDMEHMRATIEAIALSAEPVVSAEKTPARLQLDAEGGN